MKVIWQRERLLHDSGTKFYELVHLSIPGKSNSVTIRRWGKQGTEGQVQVERDDFGDAFRDLKESKLRRGYLVDSKHHGECYLEEFFNGAPTYKRLRSDIIQRLLLGGDPAMNRTVSEPPVEAPKPKVDRSKDPLWGSW